MSQQVIHILDENTANKIAAGEVVERPAAVVKELVENSIDAGSKNIEIEIVEGGIKSIRVTDDGQGMSHEDAQLAVKRHATSKLRTAEDLAAIHSLGFRGEALPSIAAVSKFTLTSRLQAETLATYVEVNGGIIADIREAGAGCGTTITVTDLFFNTPARRKFLKTPPAESGHISDIVTKLSLSYPQIAFKLTSNGRLTFSTGGNGRLIDTIADIYGHKVTPELLPVEYSNEGISVSGYVAKPVLLKSSRQWQTFMVNQRVVNSRMLAKALDNAYFSLLPKNGHPLAILDIQIAAEAVDVNVHPQKKEVKFSDDQKIYRAVYKAISSSLTSPVSHMQAAATVQPGPAASISPRFPGSTGSDRYSNAHKYIVANKSEDSAAQSWAPTLWREENTSLAEVRQTIKQEDQLKECSEAIVAAESACPLYPLGQIETCYIIAQGQDGLYIIDQHAAHERILYDRMSRSTGRVPAQQLLVAQYLEFTKDDCNIITGNQDILYQLGFTLEQVGPDTMRLIEMPVDIPLADAEEVLRQVLQLVTDMHQPTAQELRHAYLQMAACRSAIKAGEALTMRQIQALLSELYTTDLPYTCPHGRPTIIRFGPDELAKLFKRT
ncbi:DNA mismatch repair protein MutL [Sporomusa silvacetica DSM 10669]|uniref:DNA mismatch repair protein MutL n=1 Tax=Sporomusa silvacetica DSM 10669 TaxID=1123289 RepID=A0ABZ3ILJ0_9FIRM|nr:DNA mismatch repair endonuclease MutL [Sporomusa silvacetica]OZC13411.1 DNA mismatch repair protein MutL [Sporomusa silvacetica DSM 10669]